MGRISPPRAIRLDVTRAERLLLPAASRGLIHVYSDAEALGQAEIACYALGEVLADKIRALGGQRRFAISRDVYDVHQLLQAGVSVVDVAPLLPAKLLARGIDVSTFSVERMLENRAQIAKAAFVAHEQTNRVYCRGLENPCCNRGFFFPTRWGRALHSHHTTTAPPGQMAGVFFFPSKPG
jgi:predicted nucleotidyltransferase component of viral defense system